MRKNIYIIMILGLLGSSCTKDKLDDYSSKEDGKGVRLHISVPQRTEVFSRSSQGDENDIDANSVYVLISTNQGPQSILLDYALAVKQLDNSYIAALLEQSSQVNVDIIVNSAAILSAEKENWERNVTTMSQVKASTLTQALPSTNSVITAMPTTHPMTGSYVADKIDANTTIGSAGSPIALTPATVKIVIENRVSAGSAFDIKGANLGAAPEKSHIMSGGDASSIAVHNYGLSADVSSMIVGVKDIGGVQTTEPLFGYESPAKNKTFVIIKAIYNNKEGYYKLGFFSDADKQNSMDLLRGYRYKIVIRAILAPGYNTAEEAITNPASNGITYDINTEDGDSYDIITNGIQYLGVSNSEYIGYHTNYINEFEMFYIDGVNNSPGAGTQLTPFLATILTYTTDPSWSEGTVTASQGITLVDESLNKVTSLPLPIANSTTQSIRKELKILMTNDFREGQLDINIGNLHKVIKVKRETSFTILGGAVSLGRDIAFASAHTLPNPMNTSRKCDPKTYNIAYSSTGTALQTGDGSIEIDPSQELFLNIQNRFNWVQSDYCYGELYLHRNTSSGRTKVSFSVEMRGGEPWGDYNFFPQTAVGQAFWRNDEKGERLIQLTQNQHANTISTNRFPYVGRWQARIISGEDFIMIDDWDPSLKATNNRFDGNPEDRPVNSTKTMLQGKDNLIQFRIGLKSTNIGSKNRYGLIQLIYIDHRHYDNVYEPIKSSCLIFVRQGETADNILTPGETYEKLGSTTNESFVAPDVKFSPYSLIDPSLGSGGEDLADHTLISNTVEPIMAPYPTYAPYLFQWGGDRMIHHTNPNKSITGWQCYYGANDPRNYNPAQFIEYCPEGYITPPSKIGGVNVDLGLSYKASNIGNSILGSCADGHMDRYIQILGDGTLVNYAPHTSLVNSGIIHGTIVFNPQTMASLYMHYNNTIRAPYFSGEYTGGAIWDTRTIGRNQFWTKDADPTNEGFAFIIIPEKYNSSILNVPKAAAVQIRCIKDPTKP